MKPACKVHGCKVFLDVRSIFRWSAILSYNPDVRSAHLLGCKIFGQNTDLTSGLQCTSVSVKAILELRASPHVKRRYTSGEEESLDGRCPEFLQQNEWSFGRKVRKPYRQAGRQAGRQQGRNLLRIPSAHSLGRRLNGFLGPSLNDRTFLCLVI